MSYSFCKLQSINEAPKLGGEIQWQEYFKSPRGAELIRLESVYQSQLFRKGKKIAFVAPSLPHPCELELWNECAKNIGFTAKLITHKRERASYEKFLEWMELDHVSVIFDFVTLDGITENPTFLSGIEKEIEDYPIVVSVGESSLSSYQITKVKRANHSRLIIWQQSPRPVNAMAGSMASNGTLLPQMAREKTVRREILKNSDLFLCLDKDSSSWIFMEDVPASRLKRLPRSVNFKHFNSESYQSRRAQLRKLLELNENDNLIFHLGPLVLESGAIDSLYAFKNLLQSQKNLVENTRLCFCATGKMNAQMRQLVVQLGLEDNVLFLNPNQSNSGDIPANQLGSLMCIADFVIHGTSGFVNPMSVKYIDCTYDILCSLAYGIPVLSSGHGWIGEWTGRFYKTFSVSNIHSLSRLMQETIEKKDRLAPVKNSIFKSMQNEFQFEKILKEFQEVILSFVSESQTVEKLNLNLTIQKAEELIKDKQYIDAIQQISCAFEDSSLDNLQKSTLHRLIGDCFTKLGDLDSGADNYTRAIEYDPYNGKSYIGLGTVDLQRADYLIAVPHFQKALSLSPQDEMGCLGLGLAFEGLKEWKESLQWTYKACKANIENQASLFHLVKLAYKLNRFEEAEDILADYVALHPNNLDVVYTLAAMCYTTGKEDHAIQILENILGMDPMNTRAQALYAQIQQEVEKRLVKNTA